MLRRQVMVQFAHALLYLGPLLAGMAQFGWALVPVFSLIFMLWLVFLRPEIWPQSDAAWRHSPAWVAFFARLAVQLLLVALCFGIGRGIAGTLGVKPALPFWAPVVLSAVAILLGRLFWRPAPPDEFAVFADEATRAVEARPRSGSAGAGLVQARRLVAALADQPETLSVSQIERHLNTLSPEAETADLRQALLEAARSGKATRPQLVAMVLHATDPLRVVAVEDDGPTLALRALPRDPWLIALFAERLTAAFGQAPGIWGKAPSPALLRSFAETLEGTEAHAPLLRLIQATEEAAGRA
jgi:hypothetical protein